MIKDFTFLFLKLSLIILVILFFLLFILLLFLLFILLFLMYLPHFIQKLISHFLLCFNYYFLIQIIIIIIRYINNLAFILQIHQFFILQNHCFTYLQIYFLLQNALNIHHYLNSNTRHLIHRIKIFSIYVIKTLILAS